MKRPGKRQEPPCLLRVGAMERPRDVHPDHVPVQIVDPNGGWPMEADFPARVVNAYEALAKVRGIPLERAMAKVIVAAARRDAGEGTGGE